jgi:hypothetical protein
MNTNGFNWNAERQNGLDKRIWEASKDIRVLRPLFKLFGKQGEYATNIIGHRVNSGSADSVSAEFASALSISVNQNRTPVKLSCDFVIRQEQFKDEDTHHAGSRRGLLGCRGRRGGNVARQTCRPLPEAAQCERRKFGSTDGLVSRL